MTIEDDRQAIADLVRRESIHHIAPAEIRVNGDRALCESNAQIVTIDWEQLRDLRPSYRICAYAIAQKGYEIAQDELGDDRPDLLEPFSAAAERLLAGDP
jgi:hypothetical protein